MQLSSQKCCLTVSEGLSSMEICRSGYICRGVKMFQKDLVVWKLLPAVEVKAFIPSVSEGLSSMEMLLWLGQLFSLQ